jgi:hypothetical protein
MSGYDYENTDYFSVPDTSTGADSKSIKRSAMDNLINQDMIKTDEYRVIKVRKMTGGYVHIKPD